MTKFNSMFSLSTLAVASGVLALAAFSGGAEASMTSRLQQCNSTAKDKVVQCCHQVTQNEKPLWMKESGDSCETAVICARRGSHGGQRRCYVRISIGDGQGSTIPNNPGVKLRPITFNSVPEIR